MLNEPNIESPANIDASVMFRDHREKYEQKVRDLVLKSMEDI
jgi:ubiquitin-protein ligase